MISKSSGRVHARGLNAARAAGFASAVAAWPAVAARPLCVGDASPPCAIAIAIANAAQHIGRIDACGVIF